MRRTGILGVTGEPLAALDDARFSRTMARVDRCARVHELRLAALLVDVERDERWIDAWLRELRAANDERKRIVHALAHERVPEPSELDDPALRRWLRDVGRDAVSDVLELARADGRDTSVLEERAPRDRARAPARDASSRSEARTCWPDRR
jgi:hypothetical protein